MIITGAGLLSKTAKYSSRPVTGLGNKGLLKVLNGTKLILDNHGYSLDSFRISLESFRFFRGPLLPKPVTGQELFFATSYSKLALKLDVKDNLIPFYNASEQLSIPLYKLPLVVAIFLRFFWCQRVIWNTVFR